MHEALIAAGFLLALAFSMVGVFILGWLWRSPAPPGRNEAGCHGTTRPRSPS